MNQSPRSKRSILLLTLAALSFFLLALAPHRLAAQQQQQRGRTRTSQRRPAAVNKDAEKARRAEAIALLVETAERARSFDDLFYRARIQALAADALWSYDQEHARSIFRRAWEAAKASDKAEQEEAGRAPGAVSPVTNENAITEARDEVFLKAAARDPLLAEVFLKDLSKDDDGDKTATTPSQGQSTTRRTPWRELSVADATRLGFAFELLGRGESNSAAQLAASLVSRGTSADLIAFIIRLRERNALAADKLYGLLLAQARTDASADANSVLLLSSPVISPELLVVIDERGSLQFRPLPPDDALETTKAPPITGAVRSAFYQTAAHLLLRPTAPRDDSGTTTTQQSFALYLALGRLLPFFESEAAQYVPELRARESALAAEMETSRRDVLASHFDLRRVTPEGTGGDPLRVLFEQLTRAQGDTERDRIQLWIVRAAARKRLWDRARRAAGEIENVDSRRAALSFVSVSQISDLARTYADDEENDYESIIKFLKGADVPPLASAWGYAEAALVAARRKDSSDALPLLDEAERYAARVDGGTRQRVAAYVIVAGAAARLDKARAWTLLYDVVKASNAMRDFTGDELSLDITARENQPPDAPDSFSVTSEAFRFDKIFATMAQLDLMKTLSDARALEGDVPQAFAYIAIARAVLDKKQG